MCMPLNPFFTLLMTTSLFLAMLNDHSKSQAAGPWLKNQWKEKSRETKWLRLIIPKIAKLSKTVCLSVYCLELFLPGILNLYFRSKVRNSE